MHLLAKEHDSSEVYFISSYFFEKMVEPKGRGHYRFDMVESWGRRVRQLS